MNVQEIVGISGSKCKVKDIEEIKTLGTITSSFLRFLIRYYEDSFLVLPEIIVTIDCLTKSRNGAYPLCLHRLFSSVQKPLRS